AETSVQAGITDTFVRTSGELATQEKRLEDILLYRTAPEGNVLRAELAITPSRTFPNDELVSGAVHLDILAGREAVRGTSGGGEGLTVEAGEARLLVPTRAPAHGTARA